MYDIHSHVLFGIDDGAKTVDDAVGLCQMAHDDGVTAIVATPHIREPMWRNDRKTIEGRLADLRGELAEREIDIDVVLGSEVYFDSAMVEAVLDGSYPTYAGSERYLLFELPNFFLMRQVQDVVFQFRTAGLTPVLAHPERNPQIMKNVEAVDELVRMGALMQVTAMSITGRFGRQAKKGADYFLDRGLAHVIASDAHSAQFRPSILSEAHKKVQKRYGDAVAETLFVSNPRAIIEGGEVETDLPVRKTGLGGLLGKLRGA